MKKQSFFFILKILFFLFLSLLTVIGIFFLFNSTKNFYKAGLNKKELDSNHFLLKEEPLQIKEKKTFQLEEKNCFFLFFKKSFLIGIFFVYLLKHKKSFISKGLHSISMVLEEHNLTSSQKPQEEKNKKQNIEKENLDFYYFNERFLKNKSFKTK